MRGHEALIAMRRRGKAPRWVFIDAGDDPHGLHTDWQVETPYRAHVEVAGADLITSLDFRFVVGLSVLITGDDLARLKRIAEACEECEAVRVTVGHTTEFLEIHPGKHNAQHADPVA